MTGHIKTAAYAGECRLCPPPLFLILVSFLQIGFFIHQVGKLTGEVFFWRAHSTGPFLIAHSTGPFVEWPLNWSIFVRAHLNDPFFKIPFNWSLFREPIQLVPL